MRITSKLSLPAAAAGRMALALAVAPTKAQADVTWTLSGVTFLGGGTASGTFVTDDSGDLLSWDITTTATPAIVAQTYDGAVVDHVLFAQSNRIAPESENTEYYLRPTAATGDFSAASAPGPIPFTLESSSFEQGGSVEELTTLVKRLACQTSSPSPCR